MRRFRLWLARKLIGRERFMANMTILSSNASFTTNVPAVAGTWILPEDEMGKKKKRSKSAGKAAAKNKQENRQKAKGGKGAR